MKKLTKKQSEVLNCIKIYREKHGFPPTLTEMSAALGVSCPTISYHLRALEKKGKLSRMNYKSRSLVLDQNITRGVHECLAYIREDFHPLWQPGDSDESILVPRHMVERCCEREVIAFRVQRDELQNLGIHPGDIIICYPISREEMEMGKLVIVERADGSNALRMPVLDLENKKIRMCYSTAGCWYFDYLRDDDVIRARAVGLLRDL